MKQENSLVTLGKNAKKASKLLRVATTEQKNQALHEIKKEIELQKESILKANLLDLEQSDLSEQIRDRLTLDGKLHSILSEIENVEKLPDPVGKLLESRTLPSQLKLSKIQVPIGVLGVIYEARPNVTVDISTLALKSGNCAILRGGKETFHTNRALMHAIQTALAKTNLPIDCIQLIENPDRTLVQELVKLDAYIDMLIPRGGFVLHRFCIENSTIPVITGGMGICHLFVDSSADIEKSIEVIKNAKTQRPSVCNSLDTVLIHKGIAKTFLPKLIHNLPTVSFRLDPKAWDILQPQEASFQKATEEDWQTEWLSLNLGIKVVDTLEEALEHIEKYSTGHSDGILTETHSQADRFIQTIDSAAVYVNASTRFTDGAEFGLGTEVAVSTQKLHARGPMGLDALTSYKWICEGNYTIREN